MAVLWGFWVASLWQLLPAVLLQTGGTAPGTMEILETQKPAYQASVQGLGEQGVRLRVGGQALLVPYDGLLRVRHEGAEKATKASDKPVSVELTDGSLIYCTNLTADKGEAKLAWPDQTPMSLPARKINACLFQPLAPGLGKQWQAIASSRAGGDVLVLQRSAEALDKIEGVIEQVSEAVVKFQFDGQSIEVQRTKLAGLRFFAPEESQRPKLLAVVRDRWGSTWMAARLNGDWTQASAQLDIDLVCGAQVSLAANSISEIDFSFGSMRFLADLQPLERKVEPRLGLAKSLPQAEELFGPRSRPAETQRGATAGPGIDFLGAGSIVYRVPDDFQKLLGTITLNPEGPQFVPCKVQVHIEDQIVWEKTLDTPHQVVQVDLPVVAGKRLRLSVEALRKPAVGDHVSWRQLRFVK